MEGSKCRSGQQNRSGKLWLFHDTLFTRGEKVDDAEKRKAAQRMKGETGGAY